ncbi:MAG: hypothetical protein Q7U13_11520 [Rhodoferax sp.]|nr:hypothetical protein [Rhodoferax sp.]
MDNKSKNLLVWASFAAASTLSLIVDRSLWWAGQTYWVLLSLLAIASAILAFRVLARTGLKALPIAGVVLGLLIGQWWLIEFCATTALWRIRGFAP